MLKPSWLGIILKGWWIKLLRSFNNQHMGYVDIVPSCIEIWQLKWKQIVRCHSYVMRFCRLPLPCEYECRYKRQLGNSLLTICVMVMSTYQCWNENKIVQSCIKVRKFCHLPFRLKMLYLLINIRLVDRKKWQLRVVRTMSTMREGNRVSGTYMYRCIVYY